MDPLYKRLNDAGIVPVPSAQGGEIELETSDGDMATLVPLSDFGITEAYVAAHPEGSDRGGYVPTVFSPDGDAFYSETAGEWQGTN